MSATVCIYTKPLAAMLQACAGGAGGFADAGNLPVTIIKLCTAYQPGSLERHRCMITTLKHLATAADLGIKVLSSLPAICPKLSGSEDLLPQTISWPGGSDVSSSNVSKISFSEHVIVIVFLILRRKQLTQVCLASGSGQLLDKTSLIITRCRPCQKCMADEW